MNWANSIRSLSLSPSLQDFDSEIQIYPSVGCGSESRSCFSEKERCAVILCVMCDEKLVETDLQRKGEIEADTKETTGDRICFSYREKKRNQVAIFGK